MCLISMALIRYEFQCYVILGENADMRMRGIFKLIFFEMYLYQGQGRIDALLQSCLVTPIHLVFTQKIVIPNQTLNLNHSLEKSMPPGKRRQPVRYTR